MDTPVEYSMIPKPVPPPPRNASREVFTAFARGNTRAELMDEMRAQAERYFGSPVTLRDAAIQPAPRVNTSNAYQATSRWVIATPKPRSQA